jgi:hypothetical protein
MYSEGNYAGNCAGNNAKMKSLSKKPAIERLD